MAASNSRLATLALHLRPDGRSPAAAEAHATAGLLNYIKGLFGGGAPAELRVGMIGLDTSHVPAFTDCLNNPENEHHVPGAKVVAAVKGGPENKGSADMPSSRDRVEGYSKQLVEEYGVQLYDTVEEMCENVDCVFLESVDGRPHLAQAAPVIAAGKALFIDKVPPSAMALPIEHRDSVAQRLACTGYARCGRIAADGGLAGGRARDLPAGGGGRRPGVDRVISDGSIVTIVTFQYSSTTLCQFSYHIR
jgi:hypothetical protein